MEYHDDYKTLAVPRTVTAEELKRAYRRLARRFHPDVSKEKDAEARFKEVQEAYEVLKDPKKRAAYDELGSDYRGGQQFRPPPDWSTHFQQSRGGAPGPDAGFSDFFSSLFGGGAFAGVDPRQGQGFHARGEDQRARLDLTLEEGFAGGSKQITLQQARAAPNGDVGTLERTLKVQVPAGVLQGQVIRLAGQGSAGRAGKGDLLLEVHYKPHRLYRLEGRDVTLELPIAPWEAALGATVATPTLGGAVDLRIAPGARSGQKLRLRGRGLPSTPAGDQYVVLSVVLPPATTPEAVAFYEQMRTRLAFNPRADFG